MLDGRAREVALRGGAEARAARPVVALQRAQVLAQPRLAPRSEQRLGRRARRTSHAQSESVGQNKSRGQAVATLGRPHSQDFLTVALPKTPDRGAFPV